MNMLDDLLKMFEHFAKESEVKNSKGHYFGCRYCRLSKNICKKEQPSLPEFYESTTSTIEKNDNINRALIKTFVMCDIPFN
ncbi:12860_t:CDS:2, partial [Entrophospora sp. SA101]